MRRRRPPAPAGAGPPAHPSRTSGRLRVRSPGRRGMVWPRPRLAHAVLRRWIAERGQQTTDGHGARPGGAERESHAHAADDTPRLSRDRDACMKFPRRRRRPCYGARVPGRRRALFLDWGGTLAVTRDNRTVVDVSGHPRLAPNVAARLAAERPRYEACLIVSNQARISRGRDQRSRGAPARPVGRRAARPPLHRLEAVPAR
jgi:hypothetical protein